MAIIVFQHHDIGKPGRLGVTLRDHAHRLDVRELHNGDSIPPDYDNVSGVIAMGGPQSANDNADTTSWMPDELAYLRGAHERGIPLVGICLGCQMVAVALGGEVASMEQPEIGFHSVQLSAPGHTDTILSGVAWDSPQFCHHGEEVTKLPDGAVGLASSKYCNVQAFKVGMRTYGFQFHFEADQPMIRDLVESAREDLHRAGYTEDEIDQQIEKHYAEFARLADRIAVNIASYLMPTGRLASV
jgi:GMP synthase-like glutamine amidotransferase